ncbi:MAG: DUF5103 domain-containing protein [Chitinophagia bacterium]|jgi:hypothetical protein
MRVIFWIVLVCFGFRCGFAQQQPDKIYREGIQGVCFFAQGDQQSTPMMELGSGDQFELHFDELGKQPRNYYYSFQLCNADWTPADLNVFEYIRGFTQNRIMQYRFSSNTATSYIHYQVTLPEKSCVPIKSGNYLLKVYLDADTNKLAFTRRLLVVNNVVPILASATQPFDPLLQNTHQKIQVTIQVKGISMYMQQLGNLLILQNNRWETAHKPSQPPIIRGDVVEFNSELDGVFSAGKEYRWADLRSIRFLSDRIDRIDLQLQPPEVYLKVDAERSRSRYAYYSDGNGRFYIATTDAANPWWQGEYMQVHFTFAPTSKQAYAGKDVFIWGDCTQMLSADQSKMEWNAEKGFYEKKLLLKQGYFTYQYVTKDIRNNLSFPELQFTEGNFFETENEYLILYYYRSFGARHDELLGAKKVQAGAVLVR